MCFSASTLRTLVTVVCLLGPVSAASAQERAASNGDSSAAAEQPADSAATQSEELTIAEVEARKQRVDALTDLDEQARTEIKLLYDQALKELQAAQESQAKAAQYKTQIEELPTELAGITEQLAALPEKPDVDLPEDKNLQELQQQLRDEQAALDELRKQITELDARIAQRSTTTKTLTEFLGTAPKQLQELQQQFDAAPPDDGDPQKQAERTLLRARIQALAQKIAEQQTELALYQARDAIDFLRKKRDLLARQVALQEQQMQVRWQKFQELRRLDAEKQLVQARRGTARAHPALQDLAAENQAFAKEINEKVKDIEQTVATLSDTRDTRQAVTAAFTRTKSMAESVGETDAIGQLLRKNRSELPDLERHHRRRRTLEQILQSAELRIYELESLRDNLVDPEARAGQYLADQTLSNGGTSPRELNEAAVEFFQKQRDLLDSLIHQYKTYSDILVELIEEEKQLVATGEEFRSYIDERVLWIRSCDSVGWILADQQRLRAAGDNLRKALAWLFTPSHWTEAGAQVVVTARERPVQLASIFLALVGLLIYRRRLRRRLREIGEEAAQGYARRFLPTLQALLLTALLSIFWPGVFALAGWSLYVTGETYFVRSLAQGLLATATFLLPLEFVRITCTAGGLADAHFGWSTASMRLLRRHLRWFIGAVVPLVFLVCAMQTASQAGAADAEVDAWRDSLGRLSFIASLILLSIFLHRILRHSSGVLEELWTRRCKGSLERLRNAWYPLCLAAPLVLVLLAALGYYYTARQIGWRMYETAWLVLGIILVRALVYRWVLINRRKLTVEQARQRLLVGADDDKAGAAPAGGAVPAVSEQELDVTAVTEQTHRLLHVALLAIAVVGGFVIWGDILPALGKLNSVSVWTFGEGAEEFLSLGALALAVLIFALAFFAARNVPGLLEITVLQRLPLDSGARYAITSLASYVIVAVGVVVAFAELGIGWGKVQWLVAAVSVGLGFGLQEIFANFVSGLIILFERPIRVGDVITVDDTSGWVSQIRIRATTIVRFDRRELIVPNKEFVTGRLLNWTHSNSTIRPDIEVGIAYGSDTEKARQLLLKIAREHPLILADPAPLATFHGFGDSALTLTLRPYLPDLGNYLDIIHQLHTTIHEEFRKAGIEIAFPQRDLHVRSIPESWRASEGNGSPKGSPQRDGIRDNA